MKRRLTIVLVSTLVLMAVAAFLFGFDETSQAYNTATVERGNITTRVVSVATVSREEEIKIFAEVEGQVDSIVADFNSTVRAGDPLVILRSDVLEERLEAATAKLNVAKGELDIAEGRLAQSESEVNSARAKIMSASAQLDQAKFLLGNAKTNLDRMKKLAKTDDIAAIEVEKAQSAVANATSQLRVAESNMLAANSGLATAEADVQVARSRLETSRIEMRSREITVKQAKTDIDKTVIRAPSDGKVLNRAVLPNEWVRPGTAVFTLSSLSNEILLHARINEADINQVKIGQEAAIKFPALPGERFKGKVVSIRQVPVEIQNVTNYTVIVAGEVGDADIFPGMSADLSIVTARRIDAIMIPLNALRFRPESKQIQAMVNSQAEANPGYQIVLVANQDSAPRAVPVKLGISNARYAELVDGPVGVGDRLVVGLAMDDKGRRIGPFRL